MTERFTRVLQKMTPGTMGGQSRVVNMPGPTASVRISAPPTPEEPVLSWIVIGLLYQALSDYSFPIDAPLWPEGDVFSNQMTIPIHPDDGGGFNSMARSFAYWAPAPGAGTHPNVTGFGDSATEIETTVPIGTAGDSLVAWIIVENFPSLATPDWGDWDVVINGYTFGYSFVKAYLLHQVRTTTDLGGAITGPTWTGFDPLNCWAWSISNIPAGPTNGPYNQAFLFDDVDDEDEITVPFDDGQGHTGEITVGEDLNAGLRQLIMVHNHGT